MDISIIIPTRNRTAQLGVCLDALAARRRAAPHDQGADFEVIIALDGEDPATAAHIAHRRDPFPITVVACDRLGVSHVKNRALERCRGRIALFLNDDVIPSPGLVEAHAAAHSRGSPDWPRGISIVGHSPWVVRHTDPVLHRLLRDTSMVFFYDRMIGADGRALRPPDHDWGFRHAWTLNYSAPTDALRAIGGYRPAIANCCFEDIELAWRLRRECGIPVLFRPQAHAPHDHPYTPAGYLDRERRLGYSAWGFAHAAPDCAAAVFGRDLTAAPSLHSLRAFAEACSRDEAALRSGFFESASMPQSSLPPGHAGELLRAIAAAHLPLKRLEFARGVLEASESRRIPGLFHPSDGLPADPDAWRCAPRDTAAA